MSKKVIIIRNAYSYDFGGGERFPVFLAESLTRQHIEPLIISRNANLLNFAKERGIATTRGWWWRRQQWNSWRIALFPIYIIWQILLYWWYRKLFAKERPSAVHIQSKDDFIAATYAAKHLRITIVWTDHADLKHVWHNVTARLKNPVGKWVYKAAKQVAAITIVSKSELREVSAHLPTSSPIHNILKVVYNGCTDVLSEYPHKSPDNKTSFVMANRLVTDKGIGEAIEAFKKLYQKYPDIKLRIAGDGPEREKFTTLAKGTDAITFMGHQTDPYKAISRADIFLQPTYHEGFSVALVEASMLAKPIIATAVGGNVEIIHDKDTGLLVPARDAKSLATAMERLYIDVVFRDTLAKNARKQYKERFDFDRIVMQSFIPLYEGKL